MIAVHGGFERIKEEMKSHRQSVLKEIKALKKPYKKEPVLPRDVQGQIDQLERLSKLYSVARVLPVKIEHLIINYKLYSDFLKRLKGMEFRTAVLEDGVVIQYWRRGTLQQGKGILKLYDITYYFKSFQHVPSGEVKDGQET